MADDLLHRLLGRYMLPDAQNSPTGLAKPPLILMIPRDIAFELRDPILGVLPGDGPVLGTAVPEATIDEHRKHVLGKHNVWPDASPFFQLDVVVLTEPIASTV